MVKITIEVPDELTASVWWAWYLDGGGDDGFLASLEDAGRLDMKLAFIDDYDMNWDTGEKIIKYTLSSKV